MDKFYKWDGKFTYLFLMFNQLFEWIFQSVTFKCEREEEERNRVQIWALVFGTPRKRGGKKSKEVWAGADSDRCGDQGPSISSTQWAVKRNFDTTIWGKKIFFNSSSSSLSSSPSSSSLPSSSDQITHRCKRGRNPSLPKCQTCP